MGHELCVSHLGALGRGRNVWVSPPKSLQFTMVLRHPYGPGIPSVVLIQFLIALAVVKSVRCRVGYEVVCDVVSRIDVRIGCSRMVEMAQ